MAPRTMPTVERAVGERARGGHAGGPGGPGGGGPGGGASGVGGRAVGGAGGASGVGGASGAGGARSPGEELVAAFVRWAADQRTATAAADRVRERSLRDQAAATATWMGVLVDLAEQAAVVTVMVAGQRRSGHLVGVGRDFCVLQTAHGRAVLISLPEIAQLWPDSGRGDDPPTGDRPPSIDLPLMTGLALLAEERSPVVLVSGYGLETAGELVAVGEDVVTLRTAPPARRLVHVPTSRVAVCELR